MIGWREARRRAVLERSGSFDVPPPKIATGPVSMTLTVPKPAPRLLVYRGRITGDWLWYVVINDNNKALTYGRATTHAEALAIGLAALEAATVAAA